jgi:hypothetical protein
MKKNVQTNAAVLWNGGHTKDRSCTGSTVQRKEIKNLKVVDVLSVQE